MSERVEQNDREALLAELAERLERIDERLSALLAAIRRGNPRVGGDDDECS
jgi:hypothetical protein